MNNIRYTGSNNYVCNNPNNILLSCEKKNIFLSSSNTIHLASKYQYIGGKDKRER